MVCMCVYAMQCLSTKCTCFSSIHVQLIMANCVLIVSGCPNWGVLFQVVLIEVRVSWLLQQHSPRSNNFTTQMILQVTVDLFRVPILAKQPPQCPHPSHPNHLLWHTSIGCSPTLAITCRSSTVYYQSLHTERCLHCHKRNPQLCQSRLYPSRSPNLKTSLLTVHSQT